jgi:DNA-binding response OmpR family regulator
MRAALGTDWSTDEAADGLEALRVVRDDDVDLVIADESSEPYGAFGLARELKAQSYPPGVIIVLERSQDSWLASWSGADRWLVQPIDAFELRRVADEIVSALDASVADDEADVPETATTG